MLQVFVMLSTSKRTVHDIAPNEVSSFVLVLRATGDGILSALRQNSICGGILPSFARFAWIVTERARMASLSDSDDLLLHPLNVRMDCDASASPCSEMVSRK
jgi:hypothetical protein